MEGETAGYEPLRTDNRSRALTTGYDEAPDADSGVIPAAHQLQSLAIQVDEHARRVAILLTFS